MIKYDEIKQFEEKVIDIKWRLSENTEDEDECLIETLAEVGRVINHLTCIASILPLCIVWNGKPSPIGTVLRRRIPSLPRCGT